MTEQQLDEIITLFQRRSLTDEIFVIVVQKDGDGHNLVDYGFKSLSDLAALVAVKKQKQKETTAA